MYISFTFIYCCYVLLRRLKGENITIIITGKSFDSLSIINRSTCIEQ